MSTSDTISIIDIPPGCARLTVRTYANDEKALVLVIGVSTLKIDSGKGNEDFTEEELKSFNEADYFWGLRLTSSKQAAAYAKEFMLISDKLKEMEENEKDAGTKEPSVSGGDAPCCDDTYILESGKRAE